MRANDPLPPIKADRARILQVLCNLLSNAAKFTPESKRIEIVTEWDDGVVRVSVEDEGIGILEHELETIFDKFVQSSRHTFGEGGTGLGLAIYREILEAHGGRIWAENRTERGARLTFELPRADALAAGRAADANPEDESPLGDQAAA